MRVNGVKDPNFEVNDPVEFAGWNGDVDGRWSVAAVHITANHNDPWTGSTTAVPNGHAWRTPYPGLAYVELTKLDPVKYARVTTRVSSVTGEAPCPEGSSTGCFIYKLNDRGEYAACSSGFGNADGISTRFIRESLSQVNTRSAGIPLDMRDFKCNGAKCFWDINAGAYPATKHGTILPHNRIEITEQFCVRGYGVDRGETPNLFRAYSNSKHNWIGTNNYVLATAGHLTKNGGVHTYCSRWELKIRATGLGCQTPHCTPCTSDLINNQAECMDANNGLHCVWLDGSCQSQRHQCTIYVDVVNLNDTPSFNPALLEPRGFEERSPPGTIVVAEYVDSSQSLGEPIGGLGGLDPDAPNGKGQNMFFSIKQVNYPAIKGNCLPCKKNYVNEDLCNSKAACGCGWDRNNDRCDWKGPDYDWSDAFSVSECDGNIIVNRELARAFHEVVYLCVEICDDNEYFPPDVGGVSSLFRDAEEQKCFPGSATPNPTACPPEYDDTGGGGKLIKVHVMDMNDRPKYRTGQLMCETGNPCLVAENAQPGSAVYLPGHHPLSTRGTAPTASFLEGGSVSVGQGKADLNVLVIEPDGNQLGYQLEQLSSDKPSANMFAIGSDGIIRVQAGAVLNYEHGGTGQNQYKITVKVFDQIDSERSCPDHYDPEVGSCYASKMLVINVLNVNDPPTFPGNYHGAKISANEDETWTKDSMQGPIATLIAGFDDDRNVLSYSIKNVPTDSAYASDQLFELEQQNGEFRVRLRCKLLGAQTPLACQDGTNSCDNKACFPILDFESKPLHKLRLHVTDNIISASNPPASTFMDINIEVLDVNEPPEFCFSGSQSQFLPALSLGEWNAFKSQAPSYNDPAYDNLRSRKGCDPAQLVESDTTMRPHLTFWVPEDAEVGHVVATMDDFYFFDTDQSHTPVEHRFALNILELALAKPTNYPSPLNEQAELRYNIDELTGVITVAKTLDLDATTNGQQDFVLTAFDGVSRGRALVRIYLKQIDEPPVAKDHVFCVDEMVGHDPFECNDLSDSALFTQKTGVPTHRRCPFVYRVESPEECGSTFPRRWIPKAAQSGADGSYDQRAFSGLYEPEDDPLEFERLGDLALGEFEVVPNCQTNARAPAECKVGGTWDSAFSLAIPLQLQVRPGTGDSLQTPESGALIDFEYQSRSTVVIKTGDKMHPGVTNFTALVVVIDRNDVPEWWGSRPAPGMLRLMPPLFGGAPSDQGTHDQWNGHHITDDLSGSTSESIKFHYKYLSPRVMRTDEDTALANPNKFNIVHETVTKTYHVPRTRAAPFQIPIHSFCSSTLGTCTDKRLRRGCPQSEPVEAHEPEARVSTSPRSGLRWSALQPFKFQ